MFLDNCFYATVNAFLAQFHSNFNATYFGPYNRIQLVGGQPLIAHQNNRGELRI